MKQYLEETKMLDYSNKEIVQIIKQHKWLDLDEFHKIKSIYEFVQNDMLFGYNTSDTLTSSQVLRDGYGQCNTKATLLMSFLRAVGIPCRIHALEVSKDFQRGATSALISFLAPNNIVHTWVEVQYQDNWFALEGVIIDKSYLKVIQRKFSHIKMDYKGYAIATKNLANPPIDWNANDTYIQKEAIIYDYGIYDSPDHFFKNHKQHLTKFKLLLYSTIGRRIMNYNVKKIRKKA